MTFKGTCVFNPMPMVVDELGPYAITRTTGGEVQPFGEVDCDHVVSSLHNAMTSSDFAKADLLLGRALGRIVAHELVHMLTRSRQHGKEGVEKAALSARQLISETLPLSAMDVERLQQERHIH
jgi:predicted thioredoxin/glutaredoxin